MKKKAKQKPHIFDLPKDVEELGKRFVRLGEALQDEDITLGELFGLSMLCGLKLRLLLNPIPKTDQTLSNADKKPKT